MNNILAVIGSNFETAWRTFGNAFEEATGGHWDDRVKAHNDRINARNHDRDTPGPYSARRGVHGSVKGRARAAEDEVPFEERVFEYMPPMHTSIGWLPDGKEAVPEVLKQMRAKISGHRDRTEQWMMSGGNGLGSEAPSQSPQQSSEPTKIDLTGDDSPEEGNDSEATSNDGDSDSNANGDGDENAKTAEEKAAADDLLNGASTGVFDMESLLAGSHEWTTQDGMFDIGDSTQQQQQNFIFDEDFAVDVDSNEQKARAATPDMNLQVTSEDTAPATGNGGEQAELADGEALDGTLPDQTQLAAMVGQDLLDIGHADRGHVVVPEMEQLEAAAGVGKRKRAQADVEEEDVKPAAKRFEGEDIAT